MSKATQLLRSVTARDLGFCALVAALLTLSPTTGSSRLWASAVLGIAGGVGVLALRLWRRRHEAPAAPQRPAATSAPGQWPAPDVLAALALVAIAFAPTLVWLYEEHTKTQWRNVHGLFVPLFVYLLARSALRRDPAPASAESSAWGFPLLVAGLGLAVLDAGVRSKYLAAVGLLLCLPGLSLLLLGARRTRLLAAPLALCAFVLPVPEGLGDPLGINAVTSGVAGQMVDASGVTVLRHSTVFITRHGPINVSQNCSGLSALYAGAALSFVLAVSARTTSRRVLLPLLFFPLTALANAARVAGIILVGDRAGMGFLETSLHGLSGLFVLWFVVACLWLCADHRGLREALS